MQRTRTGRLRAASIAAALAALIGQSAFAAGTPEDKCEGGKNDAAGKYASCIAKARKGFITTGDAIKRDAALAKCEGKVAASFTKLENAAVAAGATCPSVGDAAAVEDFVEGCSSCIGTRLGGGPLCMDPVACNANLDACDANIAGCDADLATCDGDLAVCEGDLGPVETDLAGCENDLQTCLLTSARIPKTGQTICYNDAGSVIPCAGSGRDGEYQAGDASSFTDNGNGTITDNVTGLMWEKLSDDGSIHDKDNQYVGLTAAIAKATALNGASFGGHNDWRIPNIRELATLPRYGSYNLAVPAAFHTGCVGGCTVLTCSCTKGNVYFSSTVYKGYTPAIWKLYMVDGDVYAGNATDSHYARAVRTAN